ncbi:hypothetical protein CAPTEDRAFT_212052 [Capitella teleta]|uniref:Uncharacterized protein n=1 Tax=Capitella teleta TaxID=283909 RepID=R7UPH1_CAPTE|nr:hypothetical protein CAPTEDRAFT_212052 [Capitella teleta]|eukprot:ELU05316.1 hypothetical protein CAPTEDRAFT_212052 [Capitella teleta]
MALGSGANCSYYSAACSRVSLAPLQCAERSITATELSSGCRKWKQNSFPNNMASCQPAAFGKAPRNPAAEAPVYIGLGSIRASVDRPETVVCCPPFPAIGLRDPEYSQDYRLMWKYLNLIPLPRRCACYEFAAVKNCFKNSAGFEAGIARLLTR